MYKNHDPITPICHKTNIRVGNQLSLLKIFSGQDLGRYRTFLRSKGYMWSKFQNGKFENLFADSESLQKTAKRKCPSFFDIPSGT